MPYGVKPKPFPRDGMMKITVIWALRTFIAIVSIVLILFGAGLYERLTTNQEAAERHIQVVFVEECNRRGLNKMDFQGPVLRKSDFWHYEFYWKDVKTTRMVLGQVQFFPIQSDIWFLDQGSKI